MAIRPSASVEVRTLVAALASGDDVQRESAVARLAIIGPRAMDRLRAAYDTSDRDTRLAILRVMEALGDGRALPTYRAALASGGDLAAAAAAGLRSLLDATDARTADGALDALVSTALDATAERGVRMAAFDALQDMPPDVRDRVANALRTDPDGGLQVRAAEAPRDAATEDAAWQDAVEGRLPEDPSAVRDAARHRAATTPLSAMQALVDAVRAREGEAPSPARRLAWQEVRGILHQALALRGSRIALYDLRETFEQADAPLPTTYLTAIHVLGDEACLEPIATAWTAAPGEAHAHWRSQLEAAARAIVTREKISRRSAAWKRITARFPAAVQALSTPSRTTPRPRTASRTSGTGR